MANLIQMRVRERVSRRIAWDSAEPTSKFIDDFTRGRLGVYKGRPIEEIIDANYACRIGKGQISVVRDIDPTWTVFVVVTVTDDPPAYQELHLHFGFNSEIAAKAFEKNIVKVAVLMKSPSVEEKVARLRELYFQAGSNRVGLRVPNAVAEA